MNQQIHFKFILQYLEFSLKQDLPHYELTINLKRGPSQQTICRLSIKNAERLTNNVCRLPIDQTVEFTQKMIYKDNEYQDSNIKFLFYLQANQLIGDCIINLAYHLNSQNQEQKSKQKLNSAKNDKMAYLYFKALLKSQFDSQELPQIQVPSPSQIPQTARNSSTRKMELSTRNNRARSQSPPKEFKTTLIVKKNEEEQPIDKVSNQNLAVKLDQLQQQFTQAKIEQNVIITQPEIPDKFREITALLTQEEEEIQNQIDQLDKHIKEEIKLNRDDFLPKIIDNNNNQEFLNLQNNYSELEKKYKQALEQNDHFKVIIRQQSEQLKRLKPDNQQSQSSYKQVTESALNQSTISNQEHYEKIIEKKNQRIQELSNELMELQKNSNISIIESLRAQISKLESINQERCNQWDQQEKMYKDKITQLLQN